MRLIVVSNRLPVTLLQAGDTLSFKPSIGGLATAVSSYLKSATSLFTKSHPIWIGWPGEVDSQFDKKLLRETIIEEFNAYPLFLTKKEVRDFYLGFSNRVLWPLFHGFIKLMEPDLTYWEEYRRVNERFCDEVLKVYRDGDIIWIHDYHLLLLPKLIKAKRPDALIGFFLHIPFPKLEVFNMLPMTWRQQILEGMLSSSVTGFHTIEYATHFLHAIQTNLGLIPSQNRVQLGRHICLVGNFPISIDYGKFFNSSVLPQVRKKIKELSLKWSKSKTILSIERLDYTKGTVNRLIAFEKFLADNPKFQGKVKMVLLVVPSREEIPHYKQTKELIERTLGRVNDQFQTNGWMPIVYEYRSLNFHEITAYYNLSDIALITPLIDGMNLVAKEYIAAKRHKKGVLILSSRAGSAQELKHALLVNPENITQISSAIKSALEMADSQQHFRLKAMQHYLAKHDITVWAENLLSEVLQSPPVNTAPPYIQVI